MGSEYSQPCIGLFWPHVKWSCRREGSVQAYAYYYFFTKSTVLALSGRLQCYLALVCRLVNQKKPLVYDHHNITTESWNSSNTTTFSIVSHRYLKAE